MKHRKPTTGDKVRAALRRRSVPLLAAVALLGVSLAPVVNAAASSDTTVLFIRSVIDSGVWAARVG